MTKFYCDGCGVEITSGRPMPFRYHVVNGKVSSETVPATPGVKTDVKHVSKDLCPVCFDKITNAAVAALEAIEKAK